MRFLTTLITAIAIATALCAIPLTIDAYSGGASASADSSLTAKLIKKHKSHRLLGKKHRRHAKSKKRHHRKYASKHHRKARPKKAA